MEHADLILYSNAVFTSLAPTPFVGGVAVKGNRILAVGTREQIEPFTASTTNVKELGDALIIPGFSDAHGHFLEGALCTSDFFCSTLDQAKSEEECAKMMADFAKEHPGLKRYFGFGWLPSYWGNAPFPDKRSLDRYFPDTPVYLRAVDGHSEWLNSAALKESGYHRDWKPDFGTMDTFEDGEPNGLLREGGDVLARQYDTRLPQEEVRRLQKKLMKSLNEKGITSFCEMGAQLPEKIDQAYSFLKEFDQNGEMTVRLFLYPGTDIDPKRIPEILPFCQEFNTDTLKINGLKGFADGVTSTYTAFLLADYSDKEGERGYLNFPAEQYFEWVKEANRLGFSTRVHCIGDASVRTLLDACEASNACNDNTKLRNTIEHIEIIDPADIPRFARLNVVPSMQPLHLPLDEFDKISRCGADRSRYEWAHKSILNTGAVLAMGTDFPIAGYNPLPNLYMAVTRKGVNGTQYGPYSESETLTLAEAITAYTFGSAYAQNMEHVLGTLTPGKYADIAVIDRNLFEAAPEEILSASILLTVMNGSIVYEK